MDEVITRADVASDLLPILGDRACVLAASWPAQPSVDGDIDCAVTGLDGQWPLRLQPPYRLIQHRSYDINAEAWIVERADRAGASRLFILDCLDDPHGIGRYKFPTSLVSCADGVLPDPSVRAAYLTVKRLRKRMFDPDSWAAIQKLASEDVQKYRLLLAAVVGDAFAQDIVQSVADGQPPSTEMRTRAIRAACVRRFADPRRSLEAVWKGATRWMKRIAHPTGFVVTIAGPDGVGKSTLAQQIPKACTGVFLRETHLHWRPGLLPPLSRVVGSGPPNAADPHAKPPHARGVSLAVIGYYWLDFLIGSAIRVWPLKTRTGLIVEERGWWDMCVDPRRYRLDAPGWILRVLGRLLPQPDLLLVLEAPSDVLLARKEEIPRDELERQARAWHELPPRPIRTVSLDATRPMQEVLDRARDEILSTLSDRAARDIGVGWTALPRPTSPRFFLPRGPRRSALAAMSIYQPILLRSRVGWEFGRIVAATGVLRLFPRGQAPPNRVREALAHQMPRGSTLALQKGNHPKRYVATTISAEGTPTSVAKLAFDESGAAALATEGDSIESFGSYLTHPLRAPRILERAPGLLLLEAVRWFPRSRPWVLPVEVAHGLGIAFARSSANGGGRGIAHGDFAPWNLLRARGGWVLVDWEHALREAPPFYDICHYLVQSHLLLRRPSLSALRGTGQGPPWVRDAIHAYARGAGVLASAWRGHLHEYLEQSLARLDVSAPDQARAATDRRRLLTAL